MVILPWRDAFANCRRLRSCFTFLTAVALLASFQSGTRADGIDLFGRGKAEGEARFASGVGLSTIVTAGTLLPLVENGEHKTQQSTRVVDSLLTSTLVTEAIKRIVQEERPDGSSHTSFPSGHATAAFAVATMQAHYHPRQAPLWYAGATLIGASRVQLNRHYWHDVVGGAAVGYFTARLELHSKHGLILRPFIHSEADKLGSRAAVLDSLDHIGGADSSSREAANGFAPYLADSGNNREVGFSFSRAF